MVIVSAMLNACKLNPVFDREIKARSQCVQRRKGGTRSQLELEKSGLPVTGVRKGREREFFFRSHSPSLLFRTPTTQARRSPKDYREYHIFKFAFYYSSYIRKVRNCNKRTKNPSKSLFSIDPYTYLAIQMMLTVNPVHLL